MNSRVESLENIDVVRTITKLKKSVIQYKVGQRKRGFSKTITAKNTSSKTRQLIYISTIY